MPIKVQCPTCHHMLSAPDNFAGRSGKCPSCGELVAFPAPPPAINTATSVAQKPQAVMIVAFDMPFWQMVNVSLKWGLASMIAGFLLLLPFFVLGLILGGLATHR